ncbi:MAG: hypothetical protein ABGY41_02365, partial [Candidatus Poribacteria bacterium]
MRKIHHFRTARPRTPFHAPLVAWCAVLFIAGLVAADAQRLDLTLSEDAEAIRRNVRMDNIKRDIARLTALESRVSGFPGADSASKYVFDRFQEIGLEDVETRTFHLTTPIEHGLGHMVVRDAQGVEMRAFDIRPIWPNLVRTSFLPNGLKHRVQRGHTLEWIADAYEVDATAIVEDRRNQALRNQRTDGLDNDIDGFVDGADPDGEVAPVEGTFIFVP